MTCSILTAVGLARSYTPSSLARRPLVPSGGAILGGIAGSGLCKYGLQRYLPPAKADPPA